MKSWIIGLAIAIAVTVGIAGAYSVMDAGAAD